MTLGPRTDRRLARASLTAARAVAAGSVAFAMAATVVSAERPESVSQAESRLLTRSIPDIPLQLADGRTMAISSFWRDKPLLVTFFYQRCHGICTPFLTWVRDGVRDVGGLGRDYRILALSFDETDTVADLREQARAIGVSDDPDWLFAVAERGAVERITGALDFWYRLQPSTGQYDHSALLIAIRDGRVMGALLGGPGYGERVKSLVWELRGEFAPSYTVPNQRPWRCFSFDPVSGRFHMDWGLVLLGLPSLTAMTLTLGLFRRRSGGG